MQLEKIIEEALEIKKRIKIDKQKFDELKNILIESTKGRNSSYNVSSLNGNARFTKRKEKITSLFDENEFMNLIDVDKKDLIENKVVIENFSYKLDLTKAKEYNNKTLIKSIIKENFKESYFTVTLNSKKDEK